MAAHTENATYTQQFQFIGTPKYMTPEQAEGTLDTDAHFQASAAYDIHAANHLFGIG